MRIVIADDAMIIREGLARLLVEAGCDVVATASNPTQLTAVVDAGCPARRNDPRGQRGPARARPGRAER
jgi:DNA-binding NarL/FixJ family response regulator